MKKILVLSMVICAVFLLAGYLAAEPAAESTGTEVITISPDKASEVVEKEAPAAKAGNTEEFEIKKDTHQITSTVTGNIDLDKEKLPQFKSEAVPVKGFKADARIVEMSDSKFEKTMISNNDLVRINIGSKKNVAEGDIVIIFKKGKLVTDRLNIDKIEPSISKEEQQMKKEVPVMTSIGDARIIKVEGKTTSVIKILRCAESVSIGDYIKLHQ